MEETELFCKDGQQYAAVELWADGKLKSVELAVREGGGAGPQPPRGPVVVLDSVRSGAGRGPATDFYAKVIGPVFEVLGVAHEYVRTSSADSVRELAATFPRASATTVLVMSGDTTISEFVNALGSGAGVAVFALPLGTANAWAHSVGLGTPAKALQAFVQGQVRAVPFPLYRARFPSGYSLRFFIVLSAGLHANLLHLCSAERYQRLGVERFRAASTEILEGYALAERIRVRGEGGTEQLAGLYAYFALLNTPHLEETYIPSPLSDPLVQQLHVLALESELPRDRLRELLMAGYSTTRGSQLSAPGLVYRDLGDSFTVFVENGAGDRVANELCVDGHLLNLVDLQAPGDGFDGRIEIDVVPASFGLEALVPASMH
ncbi:AaceriAFR288Cp [[Ashbya] aceris (nom. inval.)]|nr:AaceriAFR288Cp [[Ashbya] aceris (nom. inval.)]